MAIEQLRRQSDEERERVVGQVRDRLRERFPHVAAPAVDEAVHRAWTSVADARIREFLEIIVEREAAAHVRGFGED